MIDLSKIDAALVDGRIKGMPGGMKPTALGDIGRQGWNLKRGDLPLPVAVLRQDVLDYNSRWMRSFLTASGARLAPHGKTTMSPHLFKRQIDEGAWAITIGSVQQLQAIRHSGVARVILANQIVGAQALRYVVEEVNRDPAFDFYALVDSTAGVQALLETARQAGSRRPLQLLVEGGIAGGRTGARTLDDAMAVARAVKAAEPYLSLRGIEGYEGVLRGADEAESESLVRHFLQYLAQLADRCAEEGLFSPQPVIISAGGSSFYDLVVEQLGRRFTFEHVLVLRSGCYLTHDSGAYQARFQRLKQRTVLPSALTDGPQPALEIWAYVQSRPEPNKAILGMGRRDVGFDAGLPRPLKWCRPGASDRECGLLNEEHRVTTLNDQHCHMILPGTSPIQVGDMVGFGISHPCTTFDKWQVLCVVNEAYDVVSAIRTFF